MKYLAIDSDVALANREAAAWKQRGIGMDRVDNMTDALKKLMANEYLYVGINGDVIDFMPLLKTMSTITNIPLLIVTSRFTTETEVAALRNGADLYARWHKSTEDNIASVLAHVARKSDRKTPPQKIHICCDVVLSPFLRSVFVKNRRVELTRLEFDLLQYLMFNHDIVLTYQQIYSRVWGNEYEATADGIIKSTMKRLRKKIGNDYRTYRMIENVRGIGFKCLGSTDV
jgi:DNA-binding response OmpR family regulator